MITERNPRPEGHHFRAAHIRRSFDKYLRKLQPRFFSRTHFKDLARIAREKRRNGTSGQTTPVDAVLEEAQRRLEE